jgi:hypothetical protein
MGRQWTQKNMHIVTFLAHIVTEAGFDVTQRCLRWLSFSPRLTRQWIYLVVCQAYIPHCHRWLLRWYSQSHWRPIVLTRCWFKQTMTFCDATDSMRVILRFFKTLVRTHLFLLKLFPFLLTNCQFASACTASPSIWISFHSIILG